MIDAVRDPRASWLVAVDIGGTFTDVSLADPATHRLWSVKTPTDADDPSAGFERGVRQALELAGLAPSAVARAYHGTTIATNAILEGRAAATALMTTAGFRHVLEIGRHDGPRRIPLSGWVKPARPVEPDRIYEVRERLSPSGAVEVPLEAADVRAAVERLAATDVAALAISLLFSYANPAHEEAVCRIVRELRPDLAVSISADVLPAYREYERTMATVMNAALMPLMSDYLGRLEARLADTRVDAGLLIMQSSGGLASPADAARRPLWTLMSGPAAGVLGAARVAHAAGLEDVITLDVGGTSTDVALVRNHEPEVTDECRVGPWPLALPMLDVHSVGAGGGSVASIRPDGTLTVGPESAGSHPGPACYGLGGTRPTVTDAQLLLGRIPDRIAGGTIRLDAAAARAAIRSVVAEPLGLDPVAAASGIVEIAEAEIAAAIRLITTERGHDPRGYALVAGGGAGPLHAAPVAAILGIDTVIVPAAAGVLATIGLLASELRRDLVRTHVCALDCGSLDGIRGAVGELEAEAGRWFDEQGVNARKRRLRWSATMRYAEQASELSIAWPALDVLDAFDAAALGSLAAAFHHRHEERYGYRLPESPVELVSVRLQAVADVPRLDLAIRPRRRRATRRARPGRSRPVHVDRATGAVPARVLPADAVPDAGVAGPAVIERPDTTIYLLPGWRARPDAGDNLVLRREAPR